MDSRTGFLATDDGGIIKSSDGGDTWTAAGNVPEKPLAMHFLDLKVGFVLITGAALRTSDGGSSWEHVQVPMRVGDFAVTPNSVWMLCASAAPCEATISVSRDGGVTWMNLPKRDDLDPGVVMGAGTRRVIVTSIRPPQLRYSDDFGSSWQAIKFPCHENSTVALGASSVQDLWLMCGENGATIMESKEIHRSSDGGHSWKLVSRTGLGGQTPIGSVPSSGHVGKILPLSAKRAVIVLERTGIYTTSDSGKTWKQTCTIDDDIDTSFSNLVATDALHAWVISGGSLCRTRNGLTWERLQIEYK